MSSCQPKEWMRVTQRPGRSLLSGRLSRFVGPHVPFAYLDHESDDSGAESP